MDELIRRIEEQRAELDRLRMAAPGGLANFEHTQDLELTYTSNAIEGNTLTAVETTLVVEKGITIGGKPLKDHLEAVDHFGPLRYVRELARQSNVALTEMDVRNLHRLVMLRFAPEICRTLRRSSPLRADRCRTPCLSLSGRGSGPYGRLCEMARRGTRHAGQRLYTSGRIC